MSTCLHLHVSQNTKEWCGNCGDFLHHQKFLVSVVIQPGCDNEGVAQYCMRAWTAQYVHVSYYGTEYIIHCPWCCFDEPAAAKVADWGVLQEAKASLEAAIPGIIQKEESHKLKHILGFVTIN